MSLEFNSNNIPGEPATVPYEAPLFNKTKDIVPGSFIVTFVEGHSVEAHSAAIGFDISPYINSRLGLSTQIIGHCGVNITDTMLAKIRADCGVKRVNHDFILQITPA